MSFTCTWQETTHKAAAFKRASEKLVVAVRRPPHPMVWSQTEDDYFRRPRRTSKGGITSGKRRAPRPSG
jgi:hypothetical protein